MPNTNAHTEFTFNGLTDWFEVFRAGTHIDSKGQQAAFTDADLDSMIASHNAEQPAPLVVGHPKTNDPAFGWTSALKRVGDVLLAKATDVVPEFASAVEAKQYRNRSISVVPIEGGYKLRHIGFLGAVAPAVPGLADIAFNQDDQSVVYEFAIDDAVRGLSWRFSTIGRLLRGVKNWFIAEQGVEAADQLIPEYALDELNDASASIRADLAEPSLHNHFSLPELNFNSGISADDNGDIHNTPKEELDMPDPKTFSEQQLNDAVAAAVQAALEPLQTENSKLKADSEQAAFNARLNGAKTLINDLVDAGNLLPAQTNGFAEFMANLPQGEDAVIEFSVGEGDKAETKKVSPYAYMEDFLNRLGKQIEFNKHSSAGDDLDAGSQHTYSAPSGMRVSDDRAALDKKSVQYAKEHNVSYAEAVTIVSQEG